MAITLLKQKFGCPDVIIEMLYTKFQHLPTSLQRFAVFTSPSFSTSSPSDLVGATTKIFTFMLR